MFFARFAVGMHRARPCATFAVTRIPYDQAAKRLLDGALEGAGGWKRNTKWRVSRSGSTCGSSQMPLAADRQA
jgi:hypothetical protein